MLRAVANASSVTPVVLIVPTFSAFLSANQSISANVETKVACDNVEFNVGGFYSNTNFRFQPTTSGYYQFNVTGRGNGTGVTAVWFVLRKNNVNVGRLIESATSTGSNSGAMLIFLNGTVYVELFGLVNATSAPIFETDVAGGANAPRFSACLVRQA